jgi:hypothetical protein
MPSVVLPRASYKLPFRASCIRPLFKLNQTSMVGKMASNVLSRMHRLSDSYLKIRAYASGMVYDAVALKISPR